MTETLVIFFADITGSTGLYEKHGDRRAQKLVTECLQGLIRRVEECGGALIQKVGDEVMARFPNPDAAFAAAVQMQADRSSELVKIRVGFHYGPVIEKDGDYFGDTVNTAARMATRATAGEIMTTQASVDELSVANQAKVRHVDTTTVKGKDEMISIFEILWEDEEDEDFTIIDALPAIDAESSSAHLVITFQGSTYRVGNELKSVSIGRSSENDLVVSHNRASRRHARIEFKQDKFFLTDLSSNGTYVDIDGLQSTTLKREATELMGNGSVGFGQPPEPGDPDNLDFRRVDE